METLEGRFPSSVSPGLHGPLARGSRGMKFKMKFTMSCLRSTDLEFQVVELRNLHFKMNCCKHLVISKFGTTGWEM